MDYSIKHSPSFSVVEFKLALGEQVLAQPDSMLSMSSGMEISASLSGNIRTIGDTTKGNVKKYRSTIKHLLSGENAFITLFTAKREAQHLSIAPYAIGEIQTIELANLNSFYLTKGSFLACATSINLETAYLGIKGVLSQKGLYVLHASGSGPLFISSYGAIVIKDLIEGERFVVDSKFVIAFEKTVTYELVTAAAGLKASVLSGEGLVNRYTGPGRIYYQTRPRPKEGWLTSVAKMGM